MEKNNKSVKCLECGKQVKMEIPYSWSLNSKEIKMKCPDCGHVYTIDTKREDNYEFKSIASMNLAVLEWLFIWIFSGAVITISSPGLHSPDGIFTGIAITLGVCTLWLVLVPATRYFYKKKVVEIYLQYVDKMEKK